MDNDTKRRPDTEDHLDSLLKDTKADAKDAKENFDQLYKSIVAAIGARYGKTKISREMAEHYAEAMAHITTGKRVITEAYQKAGKQIKTEGVKANKKSLAKYARDIAKMTGHPTKYADVKSDADVFARLEQTVDSMLGSGEFKKLYEAFSDDSDENDIIEYIRTALLSEHIGQYSQKITHDYTFELDSDRTLEFTAAHGSHLKLYGVKSIGHEKLAVDRVKLQRSIIEDAGKLDNAVDRAYGGLSKKLKEPGYEKEAA